MSPSEPARGSPEHVVVAGNVFLDRVYSLAGWPVRNRTNVAEAVHDNVGGVGNVVARLRALDPHGEIGVRTAVGDDLAGQIVRAELENLGVSVDGVEVVAEVPTTSATILADRGAGERASVVAWGACATARHRVGPPPRWCHFAYLDGCRGLRAEDLHALRRSGTIVSADLCMAELTDGDRSRIVDLLAATDHLIIADAECRALMGDSQPDDVRRLGRLVAGTAIVHHPAGSLWSNGSNFGGVEAAPDPAVRDVLGAGDAFAAAFIHRSRRGVEVETAIESAHDLATEFLKVTA